MLLSILGARQPQRSRVVSLLPVHSIAVARLLALYPRTSYPDGTSSRGRHAVCLAMRCFARLARGLATIVVFETHFWLCFEVIYIAWQGLLKDHRPHKMLQHEDFVFPEMSLLPDDMKPIVK